MKDNTTGPDVENRNTIAAVATPHGEGGISVIRISGPESLHIASKIVGIRQKLISVKSHSVVHTSVYNGKQFIDEVLIAIFRAPRSYTGEDTVEISCHGSPYTTGLILDLLIKNGAAPAEPGEFTKRAFLNGKMDLAQAEAVADFIGARTEASRRIAAMLLKGHLSKTLKKMREDLLQACMLIEIELDFTEEDIQFASRNDVLKLLKNIKSQLEKLISSFNRGRICREGIRMVITGLPNVGKSSILNGLTQMERAIVTETPGTTRDTIEEILDIEGIQVRITDTAGIRETSDPIEKEGVRRAKNAATEADLILLVLDNSERIGNEEKKLINWVVDTDKDIICIVNKSDLAAKMSIEEIKPLLKTKEIISISALKNKDINKLVDKITRHVLKKGLPEGDEILISRSRHRDAVMQAIMHINKAEESLLNNMSQEFIALDMRGAADTLGSITGEISSDDILNKIFSDFCIGK
ncbi:tRNA uridine-5-carboxymethylaminomethyl(34) synthesis GTPase MnmE [bacterium]|nr:tRNA uridine-5-carboxymethylaminomethyl(34) synthesis GTPase MnmE [bacterium]